MKKAWPIIQEVLICTVIVALAVGVNAFLFVKQYPSGVEVPEAAKYSAIKKDNYKVIGDIQNAQNPTEIYDASISQLETYQTEWRYQPGTTNPFEASQPVNDLPSDYIGGQTTEE